MPEMVLYLLNNVSPNNLKRVKIEVLKVDYIYLKEVDYLKNNNLLNKK